MASVGIMSMQRIHNYGSSLQAYSLRRILEDTSLRPTVSFLDYVAGSPLIREESRPTRGPARRALAKLREYGAVETSLKNKLRFFNHKRSYGTRYFPIIGLTMERNHDLDVDLQIIGSDEVFNCVQSNVNVGYSRDLFGFASRAKRVISFAASFGNTTMSKIDAAGIREQLVADLAKFADISVRDENSSSIVEQLTGVAPEVHLDPTLAYDLLNDPLVPKVRQYRGKYVIAYGYSGRFSTAENTAVRDYADRIGARVIGIGGLQSCIDEYIDCDPFTLLAYFRDASAVVTDTFHGTIFSVISEVPFVTIVRPSVSHGYGNEEKLGYLLKVLKLSERALTTEGGLAELLEQPIDFEPARSARESNSVRAREFLARNVGGIAT